MHTFIPSREKKKTDSHTRTLSLSITDPPFISLPGQKRIKFSAVTRKESAEQKSVTLAAVTEDRKWEIDAAVVRIMKARKALSHQSLLAEVLSQLAFFRPNPKVIKRRIEALIDREYLERDPEVANAYRYLA